jgi:hypothetical protein
MKNIHEELIRLCLLVSTTAAAMKLIAIEVTALLHTLARLSH